MSGHADDFVLQLRTMRPALLAWGAHVVERVQQLLLDEVGAERAASFFKVPPAFRIKDEESAARKQGKKRYEHPLEQMTDLVGARFVLLLRTDVELLERLILSHTGWTASRERHFEFEAEADPESFDYQSLHLLLRHAGDGSVGSIDVPDGTSCEVQIRTILQHAYAELCHDRVYKSSAKIPVSAKRVVARCMALMETTDLMFCDAVRELEQVSSEADKWVKFLGKEYMGIAGRVEPTNDELCPRLVETFLHLLDGVKMPDVVTVVSSDPELIRRIAARAGDGLFASPACLLSYWLVKEHQAEASRAWPAEAAREDLHRVCNDLGFAA